MPLESVQALLNRVIEAAGVKDTNGDLIANFQGLPQALAYNGDGTLNTITVTDGTDSWIQTLSYTSGVVTGVSGWVKQ